MIPKITSIASLIFCGLLGVFLFMNFQQSMSIVPSLLLAVLCGGAVWAVFFDRGIVILRVFRSGRHTMSDRTD